MQSSSSRVYGTSARIALLVPSPNTVAETEFWQMAPANVTVHTSRMPFLPQRFDEPLGEMERHVDRVFEEAASARPDIIAYGCTASSAKPDAAGYERNLQDRSGLPTVTAANALLAALDCLDVRHVAMLTPYPQWVNAKECRFFAANGIDVVAEESVIVDPLQEQLLNMCTVPSELLIERAVALGSREDVEAVVLSCCDMPTLPAIPAIESALGKPVVSSAQALFWRALRSAGIDTAVPGAGQLLSSS
jgi:maleate cis-trans isomerase